MVEVKQTKAWQWQLRLIKSLSRQGRKSSSHFTLESDSTAILFINGQLWDQLIR